MLPATNASQLVMFDGSRTYSGQEFGRRVTMGLNGWGRQYQFNTFIPETTGTWAFFKSDWNSGIRSELFMAEIPQQNGGNSVPRNTFVNFPVTIGNGSTYAEIKFGYAENGSAASYYCTNRQEMCTTSGSPFSFASIDSRALTPCTSGCSINIPVIPGRAIYYSTGSSADGVSWTYVAPQVGLIP
jgi:hypothetical protein